MPEPVEGLFAASAYALAVWRGRRSRARAIGALNTTMDEVQRRMEGTFEQLGRAAIATEPYTVIQRERERIELLTHERVKTQALRQTADANLAELEHGFSQVQSEAKQRLDTLKDQIETLADALKEKAQTQYTLRTHLSALEKSIRSAERDRNARRVQMKKAVDLAEQEVLVRAAAELDVTHAKLTAQRADMNEQVETLAPPIRRLERELAELKQQRSTVLQMLATEQRKLDGHRTALAATEKSQDRDLRRIGDEITQLLIAAGRQVERHQLDAPEFEDLLRQCSQQRQEANQVTASVATLERERDEFSPPTYRKGLLVAAVTLGMGLALLVLLLVLLMGP